MKKSYVYLAAAVVTVLTATASADQYGYRPGAYGDPRMQNGDEQQPLPLPPDQMPPDQQMPPMPQGGGPGINIQGHGNTVIVQIAPDGSVRQAYAPQACYSAYTCQAMIPQLQYQPINPGWGCGNGYAGGCNVPTQYMWNNSALPLYGQYGYQGYRYFVYNPYGVGPSAPQYGVYPRFQPNYGYIQQRGYNGYVQPRGYGAYPQPRLRHRSRR